ncbi:MAG: PAS domain S-box protein [Desulfovibrionales bacterium]|nr:PAS domain S-box protein [Desulfovibrionales bacterium]
MYVNPADRDELKRLLEKHGKVTNLECQLRHKTGSYIWVSENINVIKDEDGNTIGYQGFNQEITELKESEEKYQDLVENINDVIFSIDMEGRITYLSPSAKNILGDKPSELLGRNLLEFIDPRDIPLIKNSWKNVLQGRLQPSEYRLCLNPDKTLWVRTSSHPLVKDGITVGITGVLMDISQRKQNEQELRECERSFEMLADKCPVSIFRFDRHGKVNFVNDWHIDKFAFNKLDKQHFLNKSVHELSGLVKAGIDDEVAKIFQGEYVEIHEVFFPEFDAGGSGWVSIRAVPIFEEGAVSGGILIRENITEHKKIESELREKSQLLEIFLDNTPDIMSVKRPDLSIIRCNKAGYELLGKPPEQVHGKTCYTLIGRSHPCDNCASIKAFNVKKPVAKEKFVPELQTFFSCRANPIISEDGNIKYVVELIRDITKEVQWRNQILFNNHFRELMSELSARFVQIVDAKSFDSAVDYTLASLGKMFEVDRGYLLRFSDDLSTMSNTHEWSAPGAARQIDRIQEFPTSNMPWFMSWMVELRPMHIPDVSALPDEAAIEREEFKFQDTKSLLCLPIYDEHKKLLGFIGFDAVCSPHNWPEDQISMLKMLAEILGSVIVRMEATRLLIEKKEQLQLANTEKDSLFSIISHDLKSPLSGVFSTSKFLAEEAESMTLKEITQISAEMHKSTRNVFDLLEDLLQWARMSQEGMDFSPEKSTIDELINSNLDTARDVADKKNISIQSNIPEKLTVMVDQAMINTVIRNLIFNAVKFTPQGGNISVTARKRDSDAEICVQDNGIGMSEKIRSSIFTVDKSKRQLGTDGEKGTGLGLILCKEFVEKHGGQIWVESEPGKGTKVFFTLPAA